MYALISIFAAAEPPTLVLMLIGSGCLLVYACIRRLPRQRSQPAGQFQMSKQHLTHEPDRRAA